MNAAPRAAYGPWVPSRPMHKRTNTGADLGHAFGGAVEKKGYETEAKSAGDLHDMIAVAEYENRQFDDAVGACTAWMRVDPRGWGDFSGRWTAHSLLLPPILDRAVRLDARLTDRTFPSNEATQAYGEILAWRKGLTALYQEWVGNPHGCALPQFPNQPQPTAVDPDLEAYKAADAAAKWIEKTRLSTQDTLKDALGLVAVGLGLVVGLKLFGGRR